MSQTCVAAPLRRKKNTACCAGFGPSKIMAASSLIAANMLFIIINGFFRSTMRTHYVCMQYPGRQSILSYGMIFPDASTQANKQDCMPDIIILGKVILLRFLIKMCASNKMVSIFHVAGRCKPLLLQYFV